jgi:hypothetical protein
LNSARSNTTHANNPNAARPNSAAGNAGHGAVAHGGTGHTNGQGVRNASYNSRGQADPLHGGRHIPDAHFRASFGRGHDFHIGHPIMIGGQASFQFGGFWFGIVDPWPTAWLYSDPVYVDFIDGGYFLVDVAHPGVQVAVSVGDAVTSCIASAAVSSTPRARKISEPAVVNRDVTKDA